MKTKISNKFRRQHRKIKNTSLLEDIVYIIKHIREAYDKEDIPRMKPMINHSGYYRIRLGKYRMGIFIEKDTVEILCIYHRKDIYKFFP